ncbi:hypothetical protein LEN26_015682 [Aphanomyces euteiches]|nr:hypothetical protein LEN26_015682 [Aphanomyces euteiches]KAH9118469.1 hypothetical protein AeMF1_008397 [Aphanomyces euteiches]KAH9184725.1 hypothetical protein AeNC1_013302 [Aphanomyces euteiches]
MHLDLFEYLSVAVTKATIDTSSPRGKRSAVYTVVAYNKESQASISTTKYDDDFAELIARICSSLERGHTCNALCPWFFVDVQHKIPKKRLFRKPTHVKVVQSHLRAYQELFDLLIAFVNSPHNRLCHRATERVPDVLYDFLFGTEPLDPAMMCVPKQRPSSASTISSCSSSVCLDFDCTLCQGTSDSCGLTTLPCGHTFHDDCIVTALNASLLCPTCASS